MLVIDKRFGEAAMFKIEAKDESGMFNDLLAERFETLEAALIAVKPWDYPDTQIHILDVENCYIVWQNY
jgi:hypothetical protein